MYYERTLRSACSGLLGQVFLFCCNFRLKNEERLPVLHRLIPQPARDDAHLWPALLRVGECGIFWLRFIRFGTLAVSDIFSERVEYGAKNWVCFGPRRLMDNFMGRRFFTG